MWRFIKENRRILIVALVALLAGAVIGLFAGLNIPRDGEAAQAGRLGVRSVLPGTDMERQTYYTRCGHRSVEKLDPAAFVGYTEEELAAFYANDHVSAFDGERVVVVRTVEGCCPEHVILRLSGQTLTVSRTDPDSLNEQLLHTLTMDEAAALTEEERAALAEGLLFESLSEIDAYLESMES